MKYMKKVLTIVVLLVAALTVKAQGDSSAMPSRKSPKT